MRRRHATPIALPHLLVAQTMQSRDAVLLCERCFESAAPMCDQLALSIGATRRSALSKRRQVAAAATAAQRHPWDLSPFQTCWCAEGCTAAYCSDACRVAHAEEHALLCEGDGAVASPARALHSLARSLSETLLLGAKAVAAAVACAIRCDGPSAVAREAEAAAARLGAACVSGDGATQMWWEVVAERGIKGSSKRRHALEEAADEAWQLLATALRLSLPSDLIEHLAPLLDRSLYCRLLAAIERSELG